MPLSKISIRNFRCFKSLELSLSEGVNFFYGSNGSGKTSLLEAIYLFSSGKSFKSTNLVALIKHNNNKFSLRGYDGAKGDVVDIELTPANVYAAYEEAVLEYSYIINLHQSKNALGDSLGDVTGTFNHKGEIKSGPTGSNLRYPRFQVFPWSHHPFNSCR